MQPRDKLLAIRGELTTSFLEREDVVEGALCALLSGNHLLLLGPPGTAKSQLAQELCGRVDGGVYFQWLLTRFSTPEEIFGAVSLRALEQDDYRRVTEGKLPRAHIAFLDEVFKASSSILNALLTVMNERLFHNGRTPEEVPLISLLGASNELPDDEELTALYDRFLLRYTVGYLAEDFRFLQLLQLEPPPERTRLSLAELDQARAEVGRVRVPEAVLNDLTALRRSLGRKGLVASDRRYRQCLDLLRARAWLDGRPEAEASDLYLLQHALWNDPEELREVRTTLQELLLGHEEEARQLLSQARELKAYADRPWETEEEAIRAVAEALTKLRRVSRKVEEVLEQARTRGRRTQLIEEALSEIAGVEKAMHQEHLRADDG